MHDTTAVPATNRRTSAWKWRLVAVVIGLGVLAVLVPDGASSRWAALSGLAVLASAVASVVLVRRAGRHVRPSSGPEVDVVVADAAVDRTAEAVPVDGAAAPAPAAPAGAVPAVLAFTAFTAVPAGPQGRDRAELLAAGGDALHEFQAEATWARQQRPATPSLDPAEGDLPSQRGTVTPSTAAADSRPPVTHWVPLDDDAMPSLRSGWPFGSRTGEHAPTERPTVGR
jgi:hypothetical protein